MKVLRDAGIALASLMLLVGCNENPGQHSSAMPVAMEEKRRQDHDYAVYAGPASASEFKERYGGSISQTLPESAPLKKGSGDPICKIAQYESKATAAAHFGRDGRVEGVNCEISKSDFDAIERHYGRKNIHNKYLNQRSYENFVTWRTKTGFITTYTEILGRAPSGATLVSYHLYLGEVEHPYYSEYVAGK